MQKRYIAPAIMLIAGAAASIINIINKVELIDYLKTLLLVLVLFYILGLIATAIITKVTSNDKRTAKEKVENPDENENHLKENTIQPDKNEEHDKTIQTTESQLNEDSMEE